jgi:NADPH:quinone reductase-like Zn-dependent oxidoreductase
MKAVLYEKPGLAYRDVPLPVPGDDAVLVKIHAASLNALDSRMIGMKIVPKGKIMGADIAGRVEAAGRNVAAFGPGDAVMGDISGCGLGGLAEYVAVPASVLAAIPTGLSFERAAALPVAAVTALQALRDRGGVRQGQKVLIHGAGGGVGTYAVQLARHFGAEVAAVCSARNAELVRRLGASQVIDYARENFSRSTARYDLIVAINGKRPLRDYLRALAPRGVLVVVGGALSQVFGAMLLGPFVSMGGKKVRLLSAKPNPADLAFIAGLVQDGRIEPAIDRTYQLEDTAEAFRYQSEGHAQGKVVITVVPGEI